VTYQSTVLIVDDDASARDTLEALLFQQGYRLEFAKEGLEALEMAAELVPDLILLDVMMPGMDGFEVCRRLRVDPRLAEVPVIMVTALEDRDSRLRGIEVGADDFVSKPFDRAELRARVRTITQLNRYRQLLQERTKFEWVVEQAEDGYLIINGDKVTYANPQARLYLGLPPTQSGTTSADDRAPIVGTFLELAQRQYRCEPQETWASWPRPVDAASRSLRYLVRPESPTAGAFWLQVDVMEMSFHKEEGYLVRLRDITANVVNQANTWTFQSLINHKLRTPLTIVTGYMSILSSDLPQYLDDQMLGFFTGAHEGVKRLQSEVLNILRHVEAPETLATDQGWCRMAEVPEIIAEANAHLKIETLNVSNELDDVDDWQVAVSKSALELIVWELLENAQKFHPNRSPIVEVRISGTSVGVRLQVWDDGRTLSPEQLVKMWMPYYQAESTFSGQVPGIGLGLTMVATLVWRVGGTCRAFNREHGPGVVVELEIPMKRARTQSD